MFSYSRTSSCNRFSMCTISFGFSSLDRHRTVHMSGESVVAIAYRDGRVHFIDMLSAQERPTVLIGHAASIRCMVVQEDRKRIFTVRFRRSGRMWHEREDRTRSREVTIWRFVVGVWKQVAAWNCIKVTNEQWPVWLYSWIWLPPEEMTIYVWVKKWTVK